MVGRWDMPAVSASTGTPVAVSVTTRLLYRCAKTSLLDYCSHECHPCPHVQIDAHCLLLSTRLQVGAMRCGGCGATQRTV